MICEAKSSDVAFLAAGMCELIKHVQSTGDAYFAKLQDRYQESFGNWFEEMINNKDSVGLVAWKNEKPIGFIVGHTAKPFLPFSQIQQVGQIHGCWVDRKSRKKGVGTKLAEAVEQWFAERKIDYVELNYITGNIEAKAFWNKLGYNAYRVATRKKLGKIGENR